MNLEKLKEAIVTFSKDGKKAYINIPLKNKWIVIECIVTPKSKP